MLHKHNELWIMTMFSCCIGGELKIIKLYSSALDMSIYISRAGHEYFKKYLKHLNTVFKSTLKTFYKYEYKFLAKIYLELTSTSTT